ncbi:molybdate transport system regulatory protein [Faecalicatena contorta]|uniref:Molybdate transport system regulatory protein n=1 Tax=Faecalicatena contorta TaxID=39482 RepID=A0A315ZSQ2_9FIRM|nr:molybdate transport system regulatory protein [Faecalicatena contorta]SUQ15758.1 molybdate transport system regulatory protein [Faecalicatena contorta]
MFHPVVKLKVYNEELAYGPGMITLLEFLRETGSMKEACTKMGMSYSKGWKIVNRAEKELGYDLLLRRHGGSMGGKCEITDEGSSLIIRFRKMEQKVNELTQAAFEQCFPEYAAGEQEQK